MGEITICKRVGGKLELNIEGLQKHKIISNLEPNVPIVFISVIADPEQSILELQYTKEIIKLLQERAKKCADKNSSVCKIKPNEKSKICMWPEAFHLKNYDGNLICAFVLYTRYSSQDLKSQQLDSLEIFLSIASSEIVEVYSKKREYRLRCIHDKLSEYDGGSRKLCGSAAYFLPPHVFFVKYNSNTTSVEKDISKINSRYESPPVYRQAYGSINGIVLSWPLNREKTFGDKNLVGSNIEEFFQNILILSNEIVKQIDIKQIPRNSFGKGIITHSDKKRHSDKNSEHSEENKKQIQTRETVSSGSTSLKYPEQHSLSCHKRISVPKETPVMPVNVSLDSDTKLQGEYDHQHQSRNSIQKQNQRKDISNSCQKRPSGETYQHTGENIKQIQTRQTVSSGSAGLKYPEEYSQSNHERNSVSNEKPVTPVNISLDSDGNGQGEYNYQHQSRKSNQNKPEIKNRVEGMYVKQQPQGHLQEGIKVSAGVTVQPTDVSSNADKEGKNLERYDQQNVVSERECREHNNLLESTSLNQQPETVPQPYRKRITESNDAALQKIENLLNADGNSQATDHVEQDNSAIVQKQSEQANSSEAAICNQHKERDSQPLQNIVSRFDDKATHPIDLSSDLDRKSQNENSHQAQRQFSEKGKIQLGTSSDKQNLYQLLQRDPSTCLQNIIVPDDAVQVNIQVNIIQSTSQGQMVPPVASVETHQLRNEDVATNVSLNLTEKTTEQADLPVISKPSVHHADTEGIRQTSTINNVHIVAEESLSMVTNSLENTILARSETKGDTIKDLVLAIPIHKTDLPSFKSTNTTAQIGIDHTKALVELLVSESREILKNTLNCWDINNTNFSYTDILDNCLEVASNKLNADFGRLGPQEVEYVMKHAAGRLEETEKDLPEIQRLFTDFVSHNIADPESDALRILVNLHVLRKKVLNGNKIQQEVSRKLLLAICNNCFLQYINDHQTDDTFLLLVERFKNFYKEEFERCIKHGRPCTVHQMKLIENMLMQKCISGLIKMLTWYYGTDMNRREKIISKFCKKLFLVHLADLKKQNLEFLANQHKALSKIFQKVKTAYDETIMQDNIAGGLNGQQVHEKAMVIAMWSLEESIKSTMREGEPNECHQKTLEALIDATWK